MKDEKTGLTPAQKKLPPALQAAILKKKGHKKHMDAEDVEARDIDDNGKIDGWEQGKANAIKKSLEKKKDKKHMDADDVEARDIDKDGEIEGWEVGKANAIKKSLEKKKGKTQDDQEDDQQDESSCMRLPTFLEWVKMRERK
jgi:hypothetical protein